MDGRISDALAAVVDLVSDGRPLAVALADVVELVRRSVVVDGVLLVAHVHGDELRLTSGRDAAPSVTVPFRSDIVNGVLALIAEPHRARALETEARPFALVLGLALAARALRERSATDALTGVGSRAVFDDTYTTEWQRALREGTTLGVLLVGVDFFDVYSDRFGAAAGDECLMHVASAAVGTLKRAGDHFARFDGARFAAVLPRTPLAGAIYAAERMREVIAALELPLPLGAGNRVSISIGVAVRAPQRDDDPADVLASADASLHRARAAGHNRVAADGYISELDVHPLDPLPAPLSRLVGREDDIETIAHAVGEAAIVTVTGPAGIGKTRTVIETAQRVAHRFAAVRFLRIRDDDGPAILAKVGAAFDVGGAPSLDTIAAATRNTRALLIVDDLESVRGDGSSTLAEIAGLPNVRILGAGRFPLGVPGERRIELPPMDDDTALRLLIERARTRDIVLDGRSENALTAAMSHLGGAPLTVELAAARLESGDATALVAELRERPGRMDAAARRATAIAFAEAIVAALPEPAALVLTALHLFRSPATAASLAEVAGIDEREASALVETLTMRGLVISAAYDGVVRYALPDIVREVVDLHARRGPDLPALVARHLAWCYARIQAAPERGPLRSALRAAVIDALVDDVRGALARASAEPALAAAGAGVLALVARALIARGRIAETTALLERFGDDTGLDDAIVARLSSARATVALAAGDYAALGMLARRARALLASSGDAASAEMANVLNYCGIAAREAGDFAAAREAWEELAQLSATLGNRRGGAIADLALGSVFLNVDLDPDRADDAFARAAHVFDDIADARNAFFARHGRVLCAAERGQASAIDGARELVAAAEATADPSFVALAWLATATAADSAGDAPAARDALAHAAPLVRTLRHAEYAFELAEGVARVVSGDDPLLAAYVLGAADRRAAEHGLPRLPLVARRRETVIARARAALGNAAFEAERSRGEAADPDDATDSLVALLAPATA